MQLNKGYRTSGGDEVPQHKRHNLLNISGIIIFTVAQSVKPSINRRSSTRSANRNGDRPAAIVTNASSSAASVQPTGSENCWPSSSRKNTRSSDQVYRTARNTNSHPDQGWNGCVTRTIR